MGPPPEPNTSGCTPPPPLRRRLGGGKPRNWPWDQSSGERRTPPVRRPCHWPLDRRQGACRQIAMPPSKIPGRTPGLDPPNHQRLSRLSRARRAKFSDGSSVSDSQCRVMLLIRHRSCWALRQMSQLLASFDCVVANIVSAARLLTSGDSTILWHEEWHDTAHYKRG